MEDVAEGLTEVAPLTDALRAESPAAAVELLLSMPGPDFAIIDAPDGSDIENRLLALLAERCTTIAMVTRDEVAVPNGHHPVLERPFGYAELQSFLLEMLEQRPLATPAPQHCALYRPE